ncbi:MAG: 30S ribosomal protein S16 [bacterium]|nr:30S ribosomal protein S16 [bacterium]
MQRTGRKGHAQFRLVVQESRRSPKSGNIVVALGSYDPHSKVVNVDKDKASFYLEHGAQPSTRVAVLLQKEGVKLPKWVNIEQFKQRAIKNTDKLRRNRPAEEPKAEVKEEAPVAEIETEVTDTPEVASEVTEEPVENTDPAKAETADESAETSEEE